MQNVMFMLILKLFLMLIPMLLSHRTKRNVGAPPHRTERMTMRFRTAQKYRYFQFLIIRVFTQIDTNAYAYTNSLAYALPMVMLVLMLMLMAVLRRIAQKESWCAVAPLKKNDDASPHRTERMTVCRRTTQNVYRKPIFKNLSFHLDSRCKCLCLCL